MRRREDGTGVGGGREGGERRRKASGEDNAAPCWFAALPDETATGRL